METANEYARKLFSNYWIIMFRFDAKGRKIAAKACARLSISESINAIRFEGIAASDRIDFYKEAKIELEKL